MTTLKILRGARELLADESRWYQGNYTDDEGDAFCAIGACMAANDDKWPAGAEIALEAALPQAILDEAKALQQNPIPFFNDAPGRTYEQVVAVLDRAIEIEEAREAEFTAEPTRELVTA